MPLQLPTAKSEYNIEEAAHFLGVSSHELRSLLIRHVLDEAEAIQNLPKMKFRPADLIMLSMVVDTSQGNIGDASQGNGVDASPGNAEPQAKQCG